MIPLGPVEKVQSRQDGLRMNRAQLLHQYAATDRWPGRQNFDDGWRSDCSAQEAQYMVKAMPQRCSIGTLNAG